MKPQTQLGLLLVGAAAIAVGPASGLPARPLGDGGTAAGADVIVGAITSVQAWGGVASGGDSIMAYSFGGSHCNIGSAQLPMVDSSNQHSLTAQNIYRLRGGKFEQVGMGWLFNGFCSLQQSLCGTCQPAGSGCAPALGVGCSDSNTASIIGSQNQLTPRSTVNASTGAFPFPASGMPAPAATIGRRCQVSGSDLDPAQNGGASYFVEVVFVNPGDALSGNAANNAGYRPFSVGSLGGNGAYSLALTGSTVQQRCAIYGWKAADPGVNVNEVNAPDGRLIVGSRATQVGGVWRYDYAVCNLSSDAGVRSVTLPVGLGSAASAQSFHAPLYHSGEPISNAPWAMSVAGSVATWQTGTFAADPNANALRWGTTYSFHIESTLPPTNGALTLGLFKMAGSVDAPVVVPGSAPGDLNHDGIVDGADLGVLLGSWGRCGGCGADLNGDGTVDGADLGILLGGWSI